MDYEGDSDEEETEEHDESPTPAEEDHEKLEPVAKRPRLT